MSFNAMAWALHTTTPTTSAKLVLIALADLVRPPAMKAFASARTLCRTTQLDRKTVLMSLSRLEHAGLITRLEETAGRGGVPVFRLSTDSTSTENGTSSSPATNTESGTGSAQATSAESGTGSSGDPSRTDAVFPANPSRFSHEPVPKTAHRTSIEPVMNQKRGRAARAAPAAPSPPPLSAAQLLPEVDAQVVEDWVRVRRTKRAPVTETAVNAIRREAEKAGLTIEQAIRMCVEKNWQSFRADWDSVKGHVEHQHNGASQAGPAPWHETAAGIKAKGEELGMPWSEDGWINGENMSFPTYSARVRRAAAAKQSET